MSGLHEVDCNGCGRRHVTNGEQARKLRVLRCDCGQFVRLDRALAERRSPTPPPPIEIVNEEDEEDATHMLSSLAAVAAINGRGRSRTQQPSLIDDERVSRPVQRPSAPRSLPPATARQPSIAPSDKPLWYVDLGGSELVQMTIEQLILARRTGKLGEGALVWREGMPSWRPVGSLIPAASASSHPSPLPTPSTPPAPSRPAPAAAIRTPLPSRSPPAPTRTPLPKPTPEDATPQSLASYERPLATLEFALEKPEPTPLLAPIRAPFPSIDSSAGPGTRAPTPLPRASLSSPFSTPFPRPAQLPQLGSLATATPFPGPRRSAPPPPPAPSPAAIASASAVPAVAPTRASDRPQPLSPGLQVADSFGDRPRWVSACIALLVCITASAAGASLVRSLRQPSPVAHPEARQKPQALATSAAPAPVVNAIPEKQPSAPPRSAASSAPLVVDLESLSVEHKRAVPRAVRVAPKPAPVEPTDTSDETAPPANDPEPASPAPEAEKSGELPAAARSNPYGSGSLIDQIKKATADEEASQ